MLKRKGIVMFVSDVVVFVGGENLWCWVWVVRQT